jgi:hypothetical protein
MMDTMIGIRGSRACIIDRRFLFSGVTMGSSGGLMGAPPTMEPLLGDRDEPVSTVVALRVKMDFLLEGGATPSRDE